MEKYKKKSLNFMGFSRELRKTERENQRYVSRQQRFSINRTVDEESITEERRQTDSRIPTIGKPKDQASSRIEMLQKWKQEKMVKKQQESKLKKPAFKVGIIKPNPPTSFGTQPLFVLDTSSRLFKSSFQVSNSQLSGKKQENLDASNAKTSAKASAKKPEVATVIVKTSAKEMKIPSSISKIMVPSKPETKWSKNKEQLSSNRKQPTIASKPPLETKKIESQLKPLNMKSKITSSVRDTKSNIPSSGLPKPTASRTLSTEAKKISSIGVPKATVSRTLSTEAKRAIPARKNNVVKSIPKFSKTVTTQQKGIPEKTGRFESKVALKSENDYLTTKLNEVAIFESELSHIEPVKEQRKSFAPPGFMFQPPIELNSSLFLEDGPSAIFMRMKNQFLRTSTPKQSPESRKSSSETEDINCLENEVIKCSEDENIEGPINEKKIENSKCSKNADEFWSSHKYDLPSSSSHESVSLNDVKPIACKQSLKFEFPEVVPTLTQEKGLFSSKITHPAASLDTDPTPGGVINPAILLDSVEIDKTEINSTYTGPADDNKTTIPFPEVCSVVIPDVTNMVKPVDCKRYLKFEFPGIISAQNPEEVLLSSNIMPPENFLGREPSPGGAINTPILPDSVGIEKAEINSTDQEGDSKIIVPFPEVDSIFEIMPNPTNIEPDQNVEKNQSVSNGFLQKQENNLQKISERKIRNFKRSEKPGLPSINESLEKTPISALKKKVLDGDFTPRRSLRLAKLSGNFSSLENLLDTPKQKENRGLKGDCTPRRSLRLSKFSTEFSSTENLFDVRRPTLYGTPEKDEAVPKLCSRVTYDFDRLSLETEEAAHSRPILGGKVSLLYTPPNKSRASIMRRSIKGDLMSFSPNS